MARRIVLLFVLIAMTGCFTTNDEGFVNYKDIDDVFSTKPQTVDYDEIGTISTQSKDFFWTSCSSVCKEAVIHLKEKAKSQGGDSVIDINYATSSGLMPFGLTLSGRPTSTPTCVTTWGWVLWTYGLGLVAPWIQECSVGGLAVTRTQHKAELNKNAQPPQTPSIIVNINNNNNSANPPKASEARPK